MRTVCIAALVLVATIVCNLQAEPSSSLTLVQKIPLLNVKGRIDHMAIDLQGRRLFVAALGNDTMEVVDLKAGRQARTISGLAEPQGILFLPEKNRIYITNGRTGDCQILDGESFQVINTLRFADDPDNIRYDLSAGRIYVGYGSGAIGVIDAATEKRLGDIKLGGHPESFQIEKDTGRIFVNVPSAKQIEVLDSKALKAEATWPLTQVQENFPMALDNANHRLFVGTRKPPKLLVLDTRSGKLVQKLTIDGTTDGVFYDAAHKRIYVSCGAGLLDVVQQKDASEYAVSERIPTAAGARTCLFAPELATIYLAVPAQTARDAAIHAYEIKP